MVEGIDDPDIQGHLESPVARLALTNGFVRDDRAAREERWVKPLSNGKAARLCARSLSESGREWTFFLIESNGKCEQLATGNDMVMNHLLGALLRRIATPGGPVREARNRRAVPALPPEDEPNDVVRQYVNSKIPNVAPYLILMRYMREADMYVSGQVTRTDHHYSHEHSTTFALEVSDMPPEHEAEIEAAANEAEEMIAEEIVDINHKIYKALEREWDYLNSDEAVEEMIHANEYEFTEEGEREDGGGFQFDQLADDAKETARDWYREGGFDYEWWDSIEDEWKVEIEEMGFQNVDIAFSGFSSQGDGASFTGNRFDLKKWTEWFFSNKPTERGHPYSDDLFLKEAKAEREPAPIPAVDDPEQFIQREVAQRAEPIKTMDVWGRRWYRRGAGGVYCKAYVYINDKLVHTTAEQYGYGDHYLTLAADWLERHGYTNREHPSEGLWRTAQRMGFKLNYQVTDVKRERDL